MRITFSIFTILICSNLFGQSILLDTNIVGALNEVNRIRHIAGLDSVSLSKELSKGCSLHAKYLAINKGNPKIQGLNAHKEYKSLKGATLEGMKAGKNSVINYIMPKESVAGWEATFYHRIPLLQPKLKEIGIGYFIPNNSYPISLVECITGATGTDTTSIVYYPAKEQQDVPTAMGAEIPHPMGSQGDYGYPITIYFCKCQEIKNVTLRLNKSDTLIDCNISTPDKPATNFPQWNTICAIPKKPLEPNTVYKISFSCTINGVLHREEYQFKTKHNG